MASKPGRRNPTTTSNALVPTNGSLSNTFADDGTGGLLQMYENTIEELRGLITCRICVAPMYEPYMIGCGHTFCYSCLSQWFCNHKTNKTCPDCRASVEQQPAPAYVVRQMTQMFMGRAELLPADESTEDHLRAKQEEAASVERDKSNTDSRIGGLFRGCFRGRTTGHHDIIQDVEDGVERCPNCAWELEEGYCTACGVNYGSDIESYYGESLPSEFDQSETDMTVSDGFHEHDPEAFHDERHFHTHQDPLNDWTGPGPDEVGDDVSLDGDGHALIPYTGDYEFDQAVAQSFAGRPRRRNGSPVTAHAHRRYAPSMLSEVSTTHSQEGVFSEREGGDEVDESGEDVDEDDEEDEEDDEDSLSGFVVHDQDEEDHTLECHLDRHSNQTGARLEDTDAQEQANDLDRFHDHSNLQYWTKHLLHRNILENDGESYMNYPPKRKVIQRKN